MMFVFIYINVLSETLEYFEEMKKISTQPNTPTFVYNNLLHVYGFHGKSLGVRFSLPRSESYFS